MAKHISLFLEQQYPLELIGIVPEDLQVRDFDLQGRPTIELERESKALEAAYEIFGKILNRK